MSIGYGNATGVRQINIAGQLEQARDTLALRL